MSLRARPRPAIRHRPGRHRRNAPDTSVRDRWRRCRSCCASCCPIAPARSARWRRRSARSGADILSVDVIERGPGCAIDDILVELPPDRLADSLRQRRRDASPGVRVESIRPYAGPDRPAPRTGTARQPGRLGRRRARWPLADGVARIFRAGWAIVLDEPVGGHGARPGSRQRRPRGRRSCPRRGGRRNRRARWTPTGPGPRADWNRLGYELAIAPLGTGALLVGRPALRWLPSELVRLRHLAAIAATVTAAG